jgi:hypothetical protein
VQGFFGGKTDLAFQRFIEIWGAMPELYLLIIFRPSSRPASPAAGAAEPVRLDGAVGLRARRIPAQPPARLRRSARALGVGNCADHLAAHPAQQPDAGGHLSAVSHERAPSWR